MNKFDFFTNNADKLQNSFYKSIFVSPHFLETLDNLVCNEGNTIEFDEAGIGSKGSNLSLNNLSSQGVELELFLKQKTQTQYIQMAWTNIEFQNTSDPLIAMSFSIFEFLKLLEQDGKLKLSKTMSFYASNQDSDYNYELGINKNRKHYFNAKEETKNTIQQLFEENTNK